MSISGVNSTDSIYTEFLSMFDQTDSSGTSSSTQVSGSQSTSGGDDTLMQSIMPSLSQMGISMPPPPSGPPPGASGSSTSDSSSFSTASTSSTSSTSSTENPAQALGKLMHDLFSAVKSESASSGSSSSSSSTSSTTTSAYSSFTSAIENLISSWGHFVHFLHLVHFLPNSTTLDTLKSDFKNLVSALQAASGDNSSSSTEHHVQLNEQHYRHIEHQLRPGDFPLKTSLPTSAVPQP